MYRYRQKNHFNFISVWSEIMSLKSNRLEVGFSIYDPEDKIRQKDTRNKSVI